MGIFRCKMCGGALEVNGTQSIATCEYCNTTQTLPRLVDDRKANLYDRASHFRRNNDFDKAMAIYEQILNEDGTDAESYWSILLCRYGIEYVEDPSTRRRIPTINRVQFTSIFDDENYRSAITYADPYQRQIYETEAAAINDIQKSILAISQKEKPFDVFICYKETDQNGRRTHDSVIATELYQELTREGFKVFFSRITLEDKLGIAYEPYIFAALNSAKVMVVLGTRPEHFNAVWVRNEWSRYLSLIKGGARKILIPAYRDMDPYDLPEEFSHLQALDMSKLGFMQDLTRGIRKIIHVDAPKPAKEAVVSNVASVNIAPLLKRASMFLDDGHFDRADDLCEQVLNQDPENAEAYLYKLMIALKVRRKEELVNLSNPFDTEEHYLKVIRFADDKLKNEISGYNQIINDRIENAKMAKLYEQATLAANKAKTEDDFLKVSQMFEEISGYNDSAILMNKYHDTAVQIKEKYLTEKYTYSVDILNNSSNPTLLAGATANFKELGDYRDSSILYQRCCEKHEIVLKEEKYFDLCKTADDPKLYTPSSISGYRSAIETIEKLIYGFKDLKGWKDSDAKVEYFKLKLEEIKKAQRKFTADRMIALQEEQKKAVIKTALIAIIVISAFVIVFAIILSINRKNKEYNYSEAIELMQDGKYEEAYDLFADLNGYENSENYALDCAILSGDYDNAKRIIKDEKITDLVIPDGVTSIGSSAFYDCSSLKSVEIPDSVTSIDYYAFGYCSSLESVVIPDGVTSIGEQAFYYCSSLKSVEIPDSVTSIGGYAFACCSSLKSVEIPDSVTSIGISAFESCSSLESVVISDSVTSIGNSAFCYCSSLESVVIPDSVTSIGNSAFYYCSSLDDIYYTGNAKQWSNIDIGFSNSNLTNATIHYNYIPK